MHPSVCLRSISSTFILLVILCLQLLSCQNVQPYTDNTQGYEYSLNSVERIYVAQPQEYDTPISEQHHHQPQHLQTPLQQQQQQQHVLHEHQQLPDQLYHESQPQTPEHVPQQQQFQHHQQTIHYHPQDHLENQQHQYQQQIHQHYHQSHNYQQQQQYLRSHQQVPVGHSQPSMQNILQQKPFDYQVNSELRIWKSASDDGEVEGLYINTYESFSVDPNGQYHLVHHQEQQQKHADHTRHINTNINVNVHQTLYNQNNLHNGQVHPIMEKMGSCSPLNPSTMYSSEQALPQTCHAAHVSSTLPGASRNDQQGNSVPNLPPLLSDSRTSHNSNVDYPLVSSNLYPYESSLMSAIRHYWREVFALCLVSAVCLNWVLAVVKRRFSLARTEFAEEITNQQASKTSWTASSLAQDSAFDEVSPSLSLGDLEISGSSLGSQDIKDSDELRRPNQHVLNNSCTLRNRSSTLKAEPIPIPAGRNRTTPNQSSSSNPSSFSNSLNSHEYNSRYSSDFDSIRRLGRGGFGVVFEAKNKIDDCHYAIKRICLPLEKEGRERVMREVRALAKLDHAGIVRYYNAWLESPPDDWLKQHDAKFGVTHSNDGGMSFPSTDGMYDTHQSKECSSTGFGEDILGDSGDKLLDLFSQNAKFKQRVNGLKNKFMRNNSSSPSLDIVFEGSGSIRLESEICTEKLIDDLDIEEQGGDNNKNGDVEDNEDFIQFEYRGRANRRRSLNGASSNENSDNEEDDVDLQDISATSHLTEPFSSSSSSSNGSENGSRGSNNNNVGPSKNSYGINGYMRNNIDTNIRDGDKEVEDKVRAAVSKSISKQSRLDRKNILTYQKEARLLSESLHTEKAYLYIQMQLCHKETLRDWLKTNYEKRDSIEIMNLFYQIVDAVEYVHSQDLIHRDLKPSNIFFSLDRTTVKIGDFGLCRAKTSTPGIGSSLDLQEYVSQPNRQFEAVHTEQVGTQLYMSPEQLNGLSYNQKVDIFAMGLILLELLIPFKTQMQRVNVLFKARNNLYSNEFVNAHQKEYELVKTLLNRSPYKRPTASEIKQHELLAHAQLSQPVMERMNQRRRTISSNSSTE